MESHFRSMAKAVSWRIFGSASTMLIFYLFSRDVKLSIGAGAVDSLVKIGGYFLHERAWNQIHFGREKPPEYEI